ncbi:MAG: hypothetical protein OHK0037_11440 [Elainellaceae cyanobacterium]
MNEYLSSHAPLVSVIIPTYNRPKYLEEALKSAVQQTYKNIEIIVSDNHSSQNPEVLVKSFQDERIQFHRHPKNLGMFENVKSAFLRASGKYVASLLDDDMWEPTFLEKMVAPLEADSSLVLAFCDHYMMDEKGEIDPAATEKCSQTYGRASLSPGTYRPFHNLSLINGSVSTAMAAVIRRENLDWNQVPPEVGSMWDIYIGYLCCVTEMGAYYCPEKLTRVRQHSLSDTQQSGRRNVQSKINKGKSEVFCYEQLMSDDRLKDYREFFWKRWVHANTTLGVGLMRDHKILEARAYFQRSLKSQFSWRTLAALLISHTPPAIASRF